MSNFKFFTGALLLFMLYQNLNCEFISRKFMFGEERLPKLLDKAIFLSQTELNIEWKKGMTKFEKKHGPLILDLELCEAVSLELTRRVESYSENTEGALKKIFLLYTNFTASVLDSSGNEIAARHYCCDKQLRDDLYLFIMCGRSVPKFKMEFYIPRKYIVPKISKIPVKNGTKKHKSLEIGPVIPLL